MLRTSISKLLLGPSGAKRARVRRRINVGMRAEKECEVAEVNTEDNMNTEVKADLKKSKSILGSSKQGGKTDPNSWVDHRT